MNAIFYENINKFHQVFCKKHRDTERVKEKKKSRKERKRKDRKKSKKVRVLCSSVLFSFKHFLNDCFGCHDHSMSDF